jgi:hypothetical protein
MPAAVTAPGVVAKPNNNKDVDMAGGTGKPAVLA